MSTVPWCVDRRPYPSDIQGLSHIQLVLRLRHQRMKHTTPRRACKNHTVWREVAKLIFEDLEAIPFEPSDFVLDSVDASVVFGALKNRGIFLNCIDSFPLSRLGKSDRVASCSCKGIHQDTASGGSGFSELICYLTARHARLVDKMSKAKDSDALCYWFWRHPEPSIVSQPYAIVVFGEDTMALCPVTTECVSRSPERMIQYALLNIPGHLMQPVVMMHLWRCLLWI